MQLEANRITRGIIAIALSVFAVVTTEFIIVGLLPLIAADLAVPMAIDAVVPFMQKHLTQRLA